MGKQVGGLSMLQGLVLDMVAEGKSPRQIAEATGLKPEEAAKMAYDLLDKEIVTDADQRRKLQVYRLEKIVEALWARTMQNADRDDVRNLVEVLDKLNTLLALNKEYDAEIEARMHQHQLAVYLNTINTLVEAFKLLAPNIMSPAEWQDWTAGQLESSKNILIIEEN